MKVDQFNHVSQSNKLHLNIEKYKYDLAAIIYHHNYHFWCEVFASFNFPLHKFSARQHFNREKSLAGHFQSKDGLPVRKLFALKYYAKSIFFMVKQ